MSIYYIRTKSTTIYAKQGKFACVLACCYPSAPRFEFCGDATDAIAEGQGVLAKHASAQSVNAAIIYIYLYNANERHQC